MIKVLNTSSSAKKRKKKKKEKEKSTGVRDGDWIIFCSTIVLPLQFKQNPGNHEYIWFPLFNFIFSVARNFICFLTYGNFLKKSHVDMLHIKFFNVETFTHRINPTKDEHLNAELKTDAELA